MTGYIPLTTAVSSPGRTRTFSPIWITPPQSLPDTAMFELCPLNTFDIGNRNGDEKSRTGGSSWSINEVRSNDTNKTFAEYYIPNKSTNAGPEYHFFSSFALGSSRVRRLMPSVAATGTNLVLEG